MDPGQLNTPPAQIEPDFFEVEGVRYTMSDDISVARYKILQRWELEYGFDASFRALWEATGEIKDAIDKRKSLSDIAYINETIRRGMQNIDRNLVFPLCVVSLWYLGPDEDGATYHHQANIDKMSRWEEAGLGMGFFFAKASGCVRGFREAWQQLTSEVAGLPPDPSPKQTSPAN